MKHTFVTHIGSVITGEALTKALNTVADKMIQMYRSIRSEDNYASHVTEEKKEFNLLKGLNYAEEVRKGDHLNNFTIWQRVNTVLTGECVALLPK